jgi:RimJ/RimL family protein N-acetyltransferase
VDAQALRDAPRRLDTPRLRLESPHPSHASQVLESINACLPQLGFIAWAQAPGDAERAERFCRGGQALVEAGDCLVFNAFLKAGGAYIGRIDLHSFEFEVPRAEVGYVGDPRRSGQGLMREAVLAAIRLGFSPGDCGIAAWRQGALILASHSVCWDPCRFAATARVPPTGQGVSRRWPG